MEYSDTVLRFDFADIDDPVYGKASGLHGELPFIQSPRKLQDRLAEIRANEGRVREISNNIISKYRDLWPDLCDEEIRVKIGQLILLSLIMNDLDIKGEKCSVLAQMFVFIFNFDDFYDALGPSAFVSFDEFDYAGFMATWRANTGVPSLDHVPSGMVEMQRFSQCFNTLMEGVVHVVPDFKEQYQEILKDLMGSSIAAHYISVGFDRPSTKATFTEHSALELRRHVSGIPLVIEFLMIFHGTHLPPAVRKDDMFIMVRNRAADIGSYVNAIFGVFRDVKHQINDSPITAAVARHETSLQEAFDRAVTQLRHFYNDYMVAALQLVQLYRNDSQVEKYIQRLNMMVDSTLFGYTIVGKYGHQDKLSVVQKSKAGFW